MSQKQVYKCDTLRAGEPLIPGHRAGTIRMKPSFPFLSKFRLITEAELGRKRRCSECGKPNLVVSYEYRNRGTVHKVVCSRECAKEFDARFWDGMAELREFKSK